MTDTSAPPSAKKARTQPDYDLLYHGGIPGRGEFVRLALEATGTPYTDVGNTSSSADVYSACAAESTGDASGNPPPFCPPMLRVHGAGKLADGDLLLSQTPVILDYLGRRVGLAGAHELDKYHVAAITATALDLNNETHDTHHPVAMMDYYEDQKVEAARRAKDFRANRLPKFFGYFERVLKGNKEAGEGKYLVGAGLTYADTTVWQVLDGLYFAFPKEMEVRKAEFPELLDGFYAGVKEVPRLKEYLASDRRLKYGNGIFRHYPELDRE